MNDYFAQYCALCEARDAKLDPLMEEFDRRADAAYEAAGIPLKGGDILALGSRVTAAMMPINAWWRAVTTPIYEEFDEGVAAAQTKR